jgi:hypothetical protein
MLDFNRLQTPPADGDILIEPPPAQWPELMARNIRQRREYRFTLAGEPAERAVQETRAVLIDHDPVVACGHQPAFVHPGVWAKHVVVRHASEAFGVEGLDLVVDNDAPASSSLSVPVVEPDGLVSRREIAFSSGPVGSPYEGRPPLSPEQIARIDRELSDLLGERFEASQMPRYLAHLAQPNPRDAVAQHVAGRASVDELFEATLPEARVSDAFGGLFLADLLLNPEPFAVAYNQALTKYRQEQGVSSPDRPLPNLGRESDRTEAALWIYQPLQRRRRLWVRRTGDQIELFADAILIGKVPARDLAHNPDATLRTLHPWVIRPRALTLTLWARLLVCDLFVHGIGGAKYDRITDEIIRRYYRCEPPAFACVSATLRLPLPVFDTTLDHLRTAHRHLRDWHFNPQRYLSSQGATIESASGLAGELLDERARLIDRSRHLREIRASHLERREVYRAIRQVNEQLVKLVPEREVELNQRIVRLERELSSNEIAQSREFFYGLQPHDRLAALAKRLRDGW